jgi:hypothetical protein
MTTITRLNSLEKAGAEEKTRKKKDFACAKRKKTQLAGFFADHVGRLFRRSK